jgi:hypothetical protein
MRRVVKRSRGLNSEPIGCTHANPLFDTREYEIEFNDGTHEKYYQANVIAENMFAQVDNEGNQFLSFYKRSRTTRKTTAQSQYWKGQFGVRMVRRPSPK